MAIHTEEIQDMEVGISKGIEESALGLIMENLQRYQYQYPIKSTVREIVCNGIDSVSDKNVALDILTNGAPVSKYFIEREGNLYKDSKFDPTYYDPKWLSTDNLVYITYHEGANQAKDSVVIEDYGTGLGGKRLQGYFNLGYSTKRLSKLPLGKFGIGAKSALSVGVQFYTVESRYNGMLFRFNVYSSKVDSIIPQFDLDAGSAHNYVLFGEGEKAIKVYYKPTTEPNGVKITIEAKKHHKQQYIDAVKSQLLYFQNIHFVVKHATGSEEVVNYKAGILYEDDMIVLSDNSMWSKPHLLLNRVNYGYINWDELELNAKDGNIGIKVDPSDVEINPSRESVIWSETTKAMVLKRFKEVVGVATGMVQEELKENDLVKWIRICYQIASRSWKANSNSIITRLANIIDLTEIEPTFPMEPSIRFHPSHMFGGFKVRFYKLTRNRKANKDVTKVEREKLDSGISFYANFPIVLVDENTSVRKDKYLLHKIYPDGFIGISAPDWIDEAINEKYLSDHWMEALGLSKNASQKEAQRILKRVPFVYEWLKRSSETIMYSSVEVPDDFTCSLLDEDEEEVVTVEDEKAAEQSAITAAERRKLEGKTIIHTLDRFQKRFGFRKTEIPINSINEWDEEEIYYGNDADSDPLRFACDLTEIMGDTRDVDDPAFKKLRLFKVAQSNNRLYADFKHIQSFYVDIKNSVITMSNALIRWNTARQISAKVTQLNFLYNFGAFDAKRSKDFREILQYLANYYRTSDDTLAYGELADHADRLQVFQMFVASEPAQEEIAKLAKELFNNPSIKDACALDMPTYVMYKELLEYAEPLYTMLNELPVLTGLYPDPDLQLGTKPCFNQYEERTEATVSTELEQEVRAYLHYKGVSDF